MSKQMGIYRITNKVSGKIYIGSSTDILQRIKKHFKELRTGNHRNRHLQSSFNLYGETAFEFDTVEYIDDDSDLISREQYWIDSISLDKLYNMNSIADKPPSWKGKTHSAQTREKLSLAKIGKPQSPGHRIKNSLGHKGQVGNNKKAVKQIDPNTGEVVAIFASEIEAAAVMGLKSGLSIAIACRGNQRKARGYRWRYVWDENLIFATPYANTKRRAVEQIDLDTGLVVATFPSIAEAAFEVGLKRNTTIIMVCQGKRKKAGGYYWRYL